MIGKQEVELFKFNSSDNPELPKSNKFKIIDYYYFKRIKKKNEIYYYKAGKTKN